MTLCFVRFQFYCTICASSGTVLLCDREDCPRLVSLTSEIRLLYRHTEYIYLVRYFHFSVYCTACMKYLLCPKEYDTMLAEDPWDCFLCRDESRQPVNPVLRPRPDWKKKITGMFRTSNNVLDDVDIADYKKKRPIRVLSLFDGLGTGRTFVSDLYCFFFVFNS